MVAGKGRLRSQRGAGRRGGVASGGAWWSGPGEGRTGSPLRGVRVDRGDIVCFRDDPAVDRPGSVETLHLDAREWRARAQETLESLLRTAGAHLSLHDVEGHVWGAELEVPLTRSMRADRHPTE